MYSEVQQQAFVEGVKLTGNARIGKLKAMVILTGLAASAYLALWTYGRISATDDSTVSFGSAWRYVGNVTLTGDLAQQVCDENPIPSCTPYITFPAQEYTNGTATAYMVVFHGISPHGNEITYAVVIDSVAYCSSTFVGSTETQNGYIKQCPSVIH